MEAARLALPVLAVAAALTAAVLLSKLKAARAELAELRGRAAAPPPPRTFESRRESFGLLWFPALTVDDTTRQVTAAVAGLPHCARCVKALSLASAAPEEWACEGCGEKRPGSVADIQVLDSVVGDALREFLQRHAGYRVAPNVTAGRRAPAA